MSQNSNAVVVTRRHLTTPEGRTKTTTGTIPRRHLREAVDAAFSAAEAGITRFRYCATSGCSPEEWEKLQGNLSDIENNPANSGGLRRKAGYLRREMKRQERRYAVDFGGAGKTASGGGGSAKAKARKAAKAAESRELRERLKNGGRRK